MTVIQAKEWDADAHHWRWRNVAARYTDAEARADARALQAATGRPHRIYKGRRPPRGADPAPPREG